MRAWLYLISKQAIEYVMDITQQLKQCGLHASESAVYIFLLQYGLATPPIVSRETMIARTNCYNILNALIEKGLVEKVTPGNQTAYRARNPEALLGTVERQREVAKRVLPDLLGMYTSNKHKPRITYYDGLAKVKTIWIQSLAADAITLAGNTSAWPIPLANETDFNEMYQNEVCKRGIALTIAKIVSRETILLYGNNAAFITFDDPVFGTIITAEYIAAALAAMLRNG